MLERGRVPFLASWQMLFSSSQRPIAQVPAAQKAEHREATKAAGKGCGEGKGSSNGSGRDYAPPLHGKKE